MIKVLVADDEKKVCQLIVNLVDWNQLGFEISGIVYDGIAAYKFLQDHPVDVMITDIRMPGYDGMELIQKAKVLYPNMYLVIISGYSQFDYAQNAIRYGVEDYLLKPLRKKDLTATLLKIAEKCKLEIKDAQKWEDIQKKLDENEARVKRSLLEDILKRPEKFGGFYSRERINEEYHYHFQDSAYQTVIIKIIPVLRREDADTKRILLQKAGQLLDEALTGMGNEIVLQHIGGEIFGVFNGTGEELERIGRKLKKVKLDILRLKDVFQELQVFIALGRQIPEFQGITDSFEAAARAMQNRFCQPDATILLDTRKLPDTRKLTDTQQSTDTKSPPVFVDNAFKKNFLNDIEILDIDSIAKELTQLWDRIRACADTDGSIICETYKEILTLFYFGVHHYSISIPDQFTELMDKLEMFGTLEEAADYLNGYIRNSLLQWLDEKKYVESKPIRIAKRYIGENYAEPLTLQMVSKEIGFNPTYFSGMFKKEADMNFSDYLKKVRIDHAKELLLNSVQTVEDISLAVGYSDTKYFSRLFKKLTGVTPTEFRRLYN